MYYKQKYAGKDDPKNCFFLFKTIYSDGKLIFFGINTDGEMHKHEDYGIIFFKDYEILALRMQGFTFPKYREETDVKLG